MSHTAAAALQALREREERLCAVQRAALACFYSIHAATRPTASGQAYDAVAVVLSTLEPIAQAHAAFLQGLLACTLLEASAAHISSHVQQLAPLYARFLSEFDRSLAAAGALLVGFQAPACDRWSAVDAFVEPIRHIETYRSIVKILRDSTPETHGARPFIVQAALQLQMLPLRPAAVEDLVKLRDLSRCLVADSRTSYEFSLIRTERQICREGTLHMAVRGQSTIFSRASTPSTPVVVLIMSDVLLILAPTGTRQGEMAVAAMCSLQSTSVEPLLLKEPCELVVWCAGMRHVLLAASPTERRIWSEWLDMAIASACEVAAQTPLQVESPKYPAHLLKHTPPLVFAGPTPTGKCSIGSAEDDESVGGTSDGEFEWELDDAQADRQGKGLHGQMGHEQPASDASPGHIIHEDATGREFTAEWHTDTGELYLTELRSPGGWACAANRDLSLACVKGQNGRAEDASMRIMSRPGKWLDAAGGRSITGGVLQGLLSQNPRDAHDSSSSSIDVRAWRMLVPGLPPVGMVKVDSALASKDGFNLHAEIATQAFVGTSTLAHAAHSPPGTPCVVLFRQGSAKRVLLATLVEFTRHDSPSARDQERQHAIFSVAFESPLSVFTAFSIVSVACSALSGARGYAPPAPSPALGFCPTRASSGSPPYLGERDAVRASAAPSTADRQRETETILQEHILEGLGERLGTQL